MRPVVLALLLAGCGAASHGGSGDFRHGGHGKAAYGTIAGLARDHDSGDPVAHAEIRISGPGIDGLRTTSNDHGNYNVMELRPGRYQLSAEFAGQPLQVSNIDVKAGEVAHVDLVFTLGHPDPITVEYGDPRLSQIDRYRPRHISEQVSIIEGTVNDVGTKGRVAGAVVTAVRHRNHEDQTEQTISDDDGRYRFDVPPGTYNVSAYYSVGGHGQIEVRRSDIAVAGAEAVIVPLWIELAK